MTMWGGRTRGREREGMELDGEVGKWVGGGELVKRYI